MVKFLYVKKIYLINNFEIFGDQKVLAKVEILDEIILLLLKHYFSLSKDTVLNALKIADTLSNLNKGFRKYRLVTTHTL